MKYLTILLTAFAAGALAAPKTAATKAAGYVLDKSSQRPDERNKSQQC